MYESKRNPTNRVVCDYIAIMTDYYAKQLYINRILPSFTLTVLYIPITIFAD
ncbi:MULTISPECIES: hypothetical protein [Geobacillus]|uniref:hypothetical protein n=1 Tax=Geobacillus TaxID=129337 RepID=UPI0009DEB1D1